MIYDSHAIQGHHRATLVVPRPCVQDVLINILLTILGYIPGIIHAVYIIMRY
jgi:uncharacterized membrane protein YqaE (UPF0057 family)